MYVPHDLCTHVYTAACISWVESLWRLLYVMISIDPAQPTLTQNGRNEELLYYLGDVSIRTKEVCAYDVFVFF